MKKEIESIEENLPKNCCTFCSHLSLEGPDKYFRYHIQCILKNIIPEPSFCCEYFKQEHTNLTTEDLDNLYLNFLETSLRISYDDYLKSIYWKLFKEKTLKNHDYSCALCHSKENLDVYHINKKLGRETDDDVIILCNKCLPKYSK